MRRPQIYISCDVETDGPIPGQNSMLNIGAVAFNEQGEELDDFSANLNPLPTAKRDPKTMEWWATKPEAWANITQHASPCTIVMEKFSLWIKQFSGRPVFVGYPASFDFLFVYWYLVACTGLSPFGFSALDIKSYASAVLNLPFRQTTKKNMPKAWFENLPPHTHLGVDDAREQGHLFFRILRAAEKLHSTGEK